MSETIDILIVDDEPRNLDTLEAILEDPGYRLLRADSAETALNSSTDVLFTAAGSYKQGDPYPRKLPMEAVPVHGAA